MKGNYYCEWCMKVGYHPIGFYFLFVYSIVFKGQTFTFDHVFGSDMSQMELYERTAASMLKNVLEGYNCTIIACKPGFCSIRYSVGS